jgi:hypothetical protein
MTHVLINIGAAAASFAFLIFRARAYVEYLKPDDDVQDSSDDDPQHRESLAA